jgi:hypothetical protein
VSAPSLAVVLAEHAGRMLVEMADALNRHGQETGYGNGAVTVRIEVSSDTSESFNVYLDEGLNTFHAMADDAGRALLDANSKRQSHWERRRPRNKQPC